jgi:hypothetical protein
MRGGEPTVITIPIADKMGNIVDTVPAVTLTFSDKPNLFISIDLKKYRGDVRTLLHHLFTIDGFDRNTTHNRETFLLGLADHQARVNNVETVIKYAQDYNECNQSTIDRITQENEKFQATDNKCDLDIELTEKNGDIIFEVKKYHRIKFGTIDCMIEDGYEKCSFDNGPGSIGYEKIPGSCKWKSSKPKKSGESYYPILEFADANPSFFRGIDYIDYRESTAWDKTFKKRQTNIFKFTVKSKRIAQLKDTLPQSIVLDDQGQPSTVEIEQKKLKDAETAKQKKIDDELAEKAREKDEAEKMFDRKFQIEGFKKAIQNVKDITDFVIKWKNDNIQKGYDAENEEQVVNKRNELNEAFLSAYNEEKRKEIVDSLKLLLQYRYIYDDRDSIRITNASALENYYKRVLNGQEWGYYRNSYLKQKSIKPGTELVYLWEIFLPRVIYYGSD